LSDLPIIVSLEIHAGADQQAMMIEIMRRAWSSRLVIPPAKAPEILPSPAELKGKILIKVKAPSRPKVAAEVSRPSGAAATELNDESSESEAEPQAPAKSKKPAKKSKVIEALSSMGVYLKGYHFSKLDSPEAIIPSHVFSLSERKLIQVHEGFGIGLFAHNMKYFMRAYPAGTRISSSNLDPSIFWRKFGVQFAALNWQRMDAGVMLNEGQFTGSGGWILKPEGYRQTHLPPKSTSTETAPRVVPCQRFNLLIEVLAAQDLPVKHDNKLDRIYPYARPSLIRLWKLTCDTDMSNARFTSGRRKNISVPPRMEV
jgi:phosphatidylinositol phospholipase C, delta